MTVLDRLIYNIAQHQYAVRATQLTKRNVDNYYGIGKHYGIGFELGG